MRDIGYRRELLERLAVRLSDLAQAHAWAAHARDLVSGALELCELADDALFRVMAAGLVVALLAIAACACWPWIGGGAR